MFFEHIVPIADYGIFLCTAPDWTHIYTMDLDSLAIKKFEFLSFVADFVGHIGANILSRLFVRKQIIYIFCT